MQLPQLYTVKQVCVALGISRTTLYRLTKQGALHSYKVGNALRYPAESVQAYLNGERYDPAGTGPPEHRADTSTYPPTPSLLDGVDQ